MCACEFLFLSVQWEACKEFSSQCEYNIDSKIWLERRSKDFLARKKSFHITDGWMIVGQAKAYGESFSNLYIIWNQVAYSCLQPGQVYVRKWRKKEGTRRRLSCIWGFRYINSFPSNLLFISAALELFAREGKLERDTARAFADGTQQCIQLHFNLSLNGKESTGSAFVGVCVHLLFSICSFCIVLICRASFQWFWDTFRHFFLLQVSIIQASHAWYLLQPSQLTMSALTGMWPPNKFKLML